MLNVPKASLRSIELDDIQLLRYWRNLDHVRSRMVIKNHIERSDQRKWFDGLNQSLARYFIFSLDSRDVGCVNLTNIDIREKKFEGGIFCGDVDFLNHWINVWACISIYNYAFFDLKLETSSATILKDNEPALSLNKSLGYKFTGDVGTNVSRFELRRKDYVIASEKIQRYLRDFAKQPL
jgi:RimJ/RimL family protein N-acetyltransferase